MEFLLGPRRQALKVTGPNGQMLKGSDCVKRRSNASDRDPSPKKAVLESVPSTKPQKKPSSPERHEQLLVQATVHAECGATEREVASGSKPENFPPLSPRGRGQRMERSPY